MKKKRKKSSAPKQPCAECGNDYAEGYCPHGAKKNQFTAKIRFDPIAWCAVVGNHTAYVLETRDGVKWWINRRGGRIIAGTSTTPSGARAACRRAFKKLEKGSKKK